MVFTVAEVARANFRTDQKTDATNTDFMKRLGQTKRYLPARLAIARSLAGSTLSTQVSDADMQGKVIKGDTLFGIGAEQLAWLTLIVEHSGESNMDVKRLIALVGAHWKRGLTSLDKDWKLSDGDKMKFIKRLAASAELAATGDELQLKGRSKSEDHIDTQSEVNVPLGEVGEEVDTKEKVFWCVNGKGGSPHSAIMGQSGTGKTVMAAAMLRSIREQVSVPLLAFDFKGDLFDFKGTKGQDTLGEVFDVQVVEPPRESIPLDVLYVQDRDEYGIDQAASRFRDSFSRLKGGKLGELQQSRIFQAANHSLSTKEPCELSHIHDRLCEIYEEEEIKKDGAISKMDDLCRFPLFEPKFTPAEFFKKSWIIKLPPGVPEDSRSIVVNLVLDALDQHLNGLSDAPVGPDGARALRIICMIDEAHEILGTKLKSLSRLIRMSRSKGGAVMLVSQSPDDFSGEEDEFLDNMGFVAAFTTNAKPKAAQRVLGSGVKLTSLKTGECLARVAKSTRRVKAWQQ